MAMFRTATVLSIAGATVAALLTASAAAPPSGPANPDPQHFKHPQDNPYFPLKPGLVTRLHGTDDGEHFRETVRVTSKTRTIAGVTATVVHDVVRRANGTLAETTDDWYAADHDGNVWYFGEDTATYDKHGHVQ